MVRRLGLHALLALLSVAAMGQEPPPQGRGAVFEEEVSVGWVLVPVSARSRHGFVADLEPAEVRLFADGAPVALGSFDRGAEAPLELVLLQDLSGSMELGGKLDASRRAVSCFLDRLRPGDRYALASFAGRRLTVEVPFTDNLQAGREAMQGWQPYGVTALHDAVAQLPEIRPGGGTAAAAVLITDGAENASRIDPEGARRIVREAQLPVYAFSLARRRTAAVDEPSERAYSALLRNLAAATGGRYLELDEVAGLAAACESVVTELRARYLLGFPTAAGEERWRQLRVEIDRPRLRIRARSGYFGPPPAAAASAAVE